MTAAQTETGELGIGRDFEVYAAGMDASLQQKLQDVLPWIKPGKIMDKGCGTGRTLAALKAIFPGTRIRGTELSDTLLETARTNAPDAIVKRRDSGHQYSTSRNTVTTAIFSSVLHEVYSYSGYDRQRVQKALRIAFMEMKESGHVIVRDGVSPAPAVWHMRLLTDDAHMWFARFATDFKRRRGIQIEWIDADTMRISSHDANEFLCKKDYHRNWSIEVNEEFGIFTRDEWAHLVAEVGFDVIHVQEIYNPWIIENRYKGQVEILDETETYAIPWPATNILVVGKKV